MGVMMWYFLPSTKPLHLPSLCLLPPPPLHPPPQFNFLLGLCCTSSLRCQLRPICWALIIWAPTSCPLACGSFPCSLELRCRDLPWGRFRVWLHTHPLKNSRRWNSFHISVESKTPGWHSRPSTILSQATFPSLTFPSPTPHTDAVLALATPHLEKHCPPLLEG